MNMDEVVADAADYLAFKLIEASEGLDIPILKTPATGFDNQKWVYDLVLNNNDPAAYSHVLRISLTKGRDGIDNAITLINRMIESKCLRSDK